MSTSGKRVLDEYDVEDQKPIQSKSARIRRNASPIREFSLALADADPNGSTLNASPSASQILDQMPEREWIAREMGVSDAEREYFSRLPSNLSIVDEPASDAQIALYKVIVKQSNLYGFVTPTKYNAAVRSMRLMTELLDAMFAKMKGRRVCNCRSSPSLTRCLNCA